MCGTQLAISHEGRPRNITHIRFAKCGNPSLNLGIKSLGLCNQETSTTAGSLIRKEGEPMGMRWARARVALWLPHLSHSKSQEGGIQPADGATTG